MSTPLLSVVILACDSHVNKGSSILHCLTSVLNQDFENFEIVLVENSHAKLESLHDIEQLLNNQKRKNSVQFTVINNQSSLGWGDARNVGIRAANGEYCVFIDDDTVVLNQDALRIVADAASRADYGYGAMRLWTYDSWFQDNAKELLEDIQNGSVEKIREHAGFPPPGIRGDSDISMQCKTFIANFGFARRSILLEIGGFPDFKGYGSEDDYVMFRLFEKNLSFAYLDNVTVVHVNHPVVNRGERTVVKLFQKYVEQGYYWFHVAKTFTHETPPRNAVLEPLQTLHYDYRVEDAYKTYALTCPPHIPKEEVGTFAIWRQTHQYSLSEYCRRIHELSQASTLEEYVQKSESDFDSLIPVISSALEHGIISVDQDGRVGDSLEFKFTKPFTPSELSSESFEPDSNLNQFPCDSRSVARRVDLFKERYPYAEFLRIAIIGDDDFLSRELVDEFWVDPIIIEKDSRIVSQIRSLPRSYAVVEQDVSTLDTSAVRRVQTFITDPPYTLHGLLQFVIAGLKLLEIDGKDKEFYVVANPSIAGSWFSEFLQELSAAGIGCVGVRKNFSQYKLPSGFTEKKRAVDFLQSVGLQSDTVQYSSSSNLYIFKTKHPDIKYLESVCDPTKMYTHLL